MRNRVREEKASLLDNYHSDLCVCCLPLSVKTIGKVFVYTFWSWYMFSV